MIKRFENFDFNEDDFDYEEEDGDIINKLIDNDITVYIPHRISDTTKIYKFLTKHNIVWRDSGTIVTGMSGYITFGRYDNSRLQQVLYGKSKIGNPFIMWGRSDNNNVITIEQLLDEDF